MLREFVDLVNEAVDEGYSRGIQLFLESLETDLAKDEVFQEHGVDKVLTHLYEQAGVQVSAEATEDSLDDVDDAKLDQMLKELEDDEDLKDE